MRFNSANGLPVRLGQMQLSNSLMYVLKHTTGEQENEIIAYFYELGIKLFNDTINKRKIPQRCNRSARIFYKNTQIYFKFDVWSTNMRDTTYMPPPTEIKVHMRASHVISDIRFIHPKNIENMLTEIGLGIGDDQVLEARKPVEKKYKCMR